MTSAANPHSDAEMVAIAKASVRARSLGSLLICRWRKSALKSGSRRDKRRLRRRHFLACWVLPAPSGDRLVCERGFMFEALPASADHMIS